MFRLLKRRKAVKSFVNKLPLALHRRFGDKRYYSFDEIASAFENRKYDYEFRAFAFALLSSRKDFNSRFYGLKADCDYDSLRKFVAKKYFNGIIDFDAASLVRFAKGVGDKSYYESNIGINSGGQ
jgi:hypothetical protein